MLSAARSVCALALLATPAALLARPIVAWPAESWASATNLTPVAGPGANDFQVDLSGAFWNPVSRRLWLCRNGPTAATSKVWCLREDGLGGFLVDTKPGAGSPNAGRAEWTGFGDAEAITQADLSTDTVFVMAEGEEVIRQYTLAVGGVVSLVRQFNTAPHLPVSGGQGSEGLAFVPDGHLINAGFVGASGTPVVSQRGMGGLFLVGHQNGGRVYAFDLSATSSAFTFVGSFLTATTELKDLFFDRTIGRLYLLHGNKTVEVATLASTPVGAASADRRLVSVQQYTTIPGMPGGANPEGLAITSTDDGAGLAGRSRSLFLTIDDGGATSLVQFKQFPALCRADYNRDLSRGVDDIFWFLSDWFARSPRADVGFSGDIGVDDIFAFLSRWFEGC